mmetsp:Transcript_12338/g.32550  ORF Transcript_12338/g.32550 Transcript_12338/m.32550 type:complete len:267 (+) Transcript_12338:362-1162(+)
MCGIEMLSSASRSSPWVPRPQAALPSSLLQRTTHLQCWQTRRLPWKWLQGLLLRRALLQVWERARVTLTSPQSMRALPRPLAAWFEKRVQLTSRPLCLGQKKPAEDGTLIFLAAGDEELYNAVAGPLDVMGKAKFYLGEVGNGANMKLVVNMLMGTLMSSLAESLALAEKSGLKQEDLLAVLGLGATSNPMTALKGPSMAQRKYPTAFPLKHQQKDIRLAIELGEQHKQALPVASAAHELYVQAQDEGQGDADFSAVLEAVLKSHK